jgi:ring-1,2-phenylacetyl-CoA epoxidase subunit PaaD
MVDNIAIQTPKDKELQSIWQILEHVADPEVPVLSIVDLGIVRDVKLVDNVPEIVITPTYSGCPAMDAIALNIRIAMIGNGFPQHKITTQLSPAWTTDWMSEAGKQKLREYGIAPPVGKVIDQSTIEAMAIHCPQCNSSNTKLLSEFGSTSCKALFQCQECKEPFDYFKCL